MILVKFIQFYYYIIFQKQMEPKESLVGTRIYSGIVVIYLFFICKLK
jgi:hypothetical protein